LEALAARRRHVVGAAPDMDLLLAPALARIVLVEAGEIAIVAFVEREVFPGREAGLADLREQQIERMLGAREHRGERDVELKALPPQLAAGVFRLRNALLRQVRILPAREQVFQIPFALAVTHEHEKTIAHFTRSVCRGQISPMPSTSNME